MIATSDLAKGVVVGVLLSGVFLAGKVSRFNRITSSLSEDGTTRTYYIEGQVFFASAGAFADGIDVLEPVQRLVIDVAGPISGTFPPSARSIGWCSRRAVTTSLSK